MALWQLTQLNKYGNSRTRIVYSSKGLKLSPKLGPNLMVKRFQYEFSHPIMSPSLFKSTNGITYLMPGWIEVDANTTLKDIKWSKPILVEKVKNEIISHEFNSSSSNKSYITKEYKNSDGTTKYSCNCPGAFRAKDKECKHIKSLKNQAMARGKAYLQLPIGIAFQKSLRKNSKTIVKIVKNRTIDDLIECNFIIPGIKENYIIKEVVQGENLIKKLLERY